jgi:hypothetical protein
MGRFFAKSGNNRGAFPDTSIEEEKSLFTNDDEKDASCPCSIEDNPVNPIDPATSCEPADPVYLPVEEPRFNTFRYQFTIAPRSFDDPGGRIDWVDENNMAQNYEWDPCGSRFCTGEEVVFCAIYGSIRLSGIIEGTVTHAFNEPCPPDSPACYSSPELERLGDCTN